MSESRKLALCKQTMKVLTGIDFVHIADHTTQTEIHVFFVIEPNVTVPPIDAVIPPVILRSMSSGVELDLADPPDTQISPAVPVDWININTPQGPRRVLRILTLEPGDFSIHQIEIDHAQLDPFFATKTFSFKQACPWGTDCKTEHECPEVDKKEPQIDYLARDFWSLRQTLLDFASVEYPEWEFKTESDMAMMLLEIMAALGDEFAYIQDRYAQEAYLSTATQPQSVINLARLVDYEPFYGRAAQTLLAFGVTGNTTSTPKDFSSFNTPDRVFALREGIGVIPFELLEAIEMRPRWNSVDAYNPDPSIPCLPIGAQQIYLEIDNVTELEKLVGRDIILRSGLAAADEPDRSWEVTISKIPEVINDILFNKTVVLIEWDQTQATPFEMPLSSTTVHLNCAHVIAGETVEEIFRVGSVEDIRTRYAGDPKLDEYLSYPRAIERQGACENSQRSRIVRYGLQTTEEEGLAWVIQGKSKKARPAITLFEIDLSDPSQDSHWEFVDKTLDGDGGEPLYTVEHGMWREVRRFRKPSGDVVQRDYASAQGFSIRFGDGAFGRAPTEDSIFKVSYLTAPGTHANLPRDTVNLTTRPGNSAPGMQMLNWVTNPFAITSAKPPELLDEIRQNAPEAFRALPRRAVRTEDYKQILDLEDHIQQSNGNTRWTGSWNTDFISVDPMGTTLLDLKLRQEIENELNCIRQSGRSVCLKDAQYLAVDIKVSVCAEASASNAKVIRDITRRLARHDSRSSYFHPDNFSFGDALIRSQLESEIHSVAGVKAVEAINVRIRGRGDFQPMEPRITIAPHQIFQLSNDPTQPHKGHLEVHAHGGG